MSNSGLTSEGVSYIESKSQETPNMSKSGDRNKTSKRSEAY